MAELSRKGIGEILSAALKQFGARVSERPPNKKAQTVGQAVEANLSSLDKHLAAAGIPREPRKPAQEKTASPAAEPTVREAAESFGEMLRRESAAFRSKELLGQSPAPASMAKDSGTGTGPGKAAASPEAPKAAASRGPSPAPRWSFPRS